MRWRDFPKLDYLSNPLQLSFWKKLRVRLGVLLRFWHFALNPQQVPFYRQQDRKGQWYTLKQGTKCYLANHDVFLELRGDRWYALGDSKYAKTLNQEVEHFVKQAESFNIEEWILSVKNEMSNEAEALLQKEMDRAGRKYTTDSQS